MTALTMASERGSNDIVDYLVAGGANVNAADNNGRTPLQLAARNGHDECVEILLANADINVDKANR
jgi:ankyrin repeat protein